MSELTRNGTDGRIYGGDCNLVHIKDGQRKAVGESIAFDTEEVIRHLAQKAGIDTDGKPLCPGCYMIALFNAAIHLADANGQPRVELGRTMSKAFEKLALDPASGLTEEIEVILDNDAEAKQ